uniref:Uncharacterized protein n=1 Tax=Globodera rostochiensis TaxID=31243 RepID=A0A914GWB1_GLORO
MRLTWMEWNVRAAEKGVGVYAAGREQHKLDTVQRNEVWSENAFPKIRRPRSIIPAPQYFRRLVPKRPFPASPGSSRVRLMKHTSGHRTEAILQQLSKFFEYEL